MKILRSMWFLAAVALVLGVGLQVYLMLGHLETLSAQAAETESFTSTHTPPSRINWDFISPEFESLRTELRERSSVVARREEELQDYEKRLKAERAELEKLKREIEAVREDLGTRLTEIEAAEQKNLKNLATTYSGMDTGAALAIFQKMDDEMVVKILAFMKPEPVGDILAMMAQTKDGEGTLAGRAAAISYKLRLLRQVKPESSS